MKVFFVDDRLEEVDRQWRESRASKACEMCRLEPFCSVERTVQLVQSLDPDLILVGYGLGKPPITGADVIRALREAGYAGRIVANSGGGIGQFERASVSVDGSADRTASGLDEAVHNP